MKTLSEIYNLRLKKLEKDLLKRDSRNKEIILLHQLKEHYLTFLKELFILEGSKFVYLKKGTVLIWDGSNENYQVTQAGNIEVYESYKRTSYGICHNVIPDNYKHNLLVSPCDTKPNIYGHRFCELGKL